MPVEPRNVDNLGSSKDDANDCVVAVPAGTSKDAAEGVGAMASAPDCAKGMEAIALAVNVGPLPGRAIDAGAVGFFESPPGMARLAGTSTLTCTVAVAANGCHSTAGAAVTGCRSVAVVAATECHGATCNDIFVGARSMACVCSCGDVRLATPCIGCADVRLPRPCNGMVIMRSSAGV